VLTEAWIYCLQRLAQLLCLAQVVRLELQTLVQLDTGRSLVPASAAPVPAVAVAPLVQEYGLPFAIRAESQAAT
jgi:hypothetical protein